MTALAQNRSDVRTGDSSIRSHPVKGSTHIFKNALVCKIGGYLAPALNTTDYSHVIGRAEQEVNNTSTQDGAASCPVRSGVSMNVAWAGGVAAAANNQIIYVADDQTVSTVSNSGVQAGYVEEYVSATVVRIFIPLGGMHAA